MHSALLKYKNSPLVWTYIIFLIVFMYELMLILNSNNGMFVYSLDDAYIHLALAENIVHGHYGINLDEVSSPASSILWPFLLAPFTLFSFSYLIPLILNIIAALLTIYFEWKILDITFSFWEHKQKNIFLAFLLSVLIFATNTVSLIFTGMEHVVQMLCAIIVLYSITNDLQGKYNRVLMIVAVVISPLIRYESIVISIAAIVYFFFRGYRRDAMVAFIGILLTAGLFSLFLMMNNLPPLPNSVLLKSGNFYATAYPLMKLYDVVTTSDRGIVFGILLLCFALFSFYPSYTKNERLFSFGAVIAVTIYLVYGNIGYYGVSIYFSRYESFIWAFSVLTFIYFARDIITRLFDSSKVVFIFIICSAEIFFAHYNNTNFLLIADSSNNIYEQQYQMHRFIVEWYNKPVAANDIGYISFNNDQNVLDLWGLASRRAGELRKTADMNPEWMDDLTNESGVELIMIYDRWLPVHPIKWVKVGELFLTRPIATAGSNVVSFYAIHPLAAKEIRMLLEKYKATLPNSQMLRLFD